MKSKKKDRPLYQKVVIDVAGFGLMIVAPFLGWLPGPGGLPLFLAGLGLVSMNHEWAENLLRDFEKKRVEWTDKYLLASPKVSLSIDFASLALLCAGSYLAITQSELLYKGIGLGTVSIMAIIILSNQKRLERMSKSIRQRLRR